MSKSPVSSTIRQTARECLEDILAIVPGHIYWKNLAGEFLGCNNLQAWDAGFKYRHEMIGLTDYDMPWKEDADLIRSTDQQVMTTGKVIVAEERAKTFDGREIIWLSRKEPLRNSQGEIMGVIGISTDITELKAKDELLEHVLAAAPGHVYCKNIKGEYQVCNNLQALDAGFKNRDEMLGLTDYDMPWKEDADFLRKIDKQVIETGESIVAEEKSKTFDGREAIWLSTKEPLRNSKGEIIGIIGTSIDITASKEAEELKLEHEKHKAVEGEQAKFKAFVEQLLHLVNSYRISDLNDKLGKRGLDTSDVIDIKLTKREKEVLYFLENHKTPKEIADILSIMDKKPMSVKTVQSIIDAKLYPKFGVYNTSQLLEKAKLLMLVPFLL